MTAKRRQQIKKQAYYDFVPNYPPTFSYGNKVLTGTYDKKCYLEGYHKAESEHAASIKAQDSWSVFELEEL
jgi:hypothetical protein